MTKSPKLHHATLADRYVLRGQLKLRLRRGNGPTIEVRVPADLVGQAGKLYGGAPVTYRFAGGRPVYVP